MMARGEVALIVTQTVTSSTLGENALGGEFMIMTVFLILISSILTPILLKVLYSKDLPLKNGPAEGMSGGEQLTIEDIGAAGEKTKN